MDFLLIHLGIYLKLELRNPFSHPGLIPMFLGSTRKKSTLGSYSKKLKIPFITKSIRRYVSS